MASMVVAAGWFPSPVAEASGVGGTTTRAEQVRFRSPDDKMATVADKVPEFGGVYPAEGRTVGVWLTRPSDEGLAAAAGALREQFPELSRMVPDVQFEARAATYGFRDLYDWYNRFWGLALNVEGAVFTDIDDAANRITVGVTDDRAERAVWEQAARAGVPAAALQVERAQREVPYDLTDAQASMVGGLAIQNSLGAGCTLGFVARSFRFGREELGFMTNSHCTTSTGFMDAAVTGVKFFQPSSSGCSNVAGCPPVAEERIDPPFLDDDDIFPVPLPPWFSFCNGLCRFSDAAFARYPGSPQVNRGDPGRIARPAIPFSVTWDDTTTFRVVSDWIITPFLTAILPDLFPITKVGKTSGRTTGEQFDLCINVNAGGIKLLCQHQSTTFSIPGDSGSPMFVEFPAGSGDAFLVGMLWGGPNNMPIFSTFSGMDAIEMEIGDLDPCIQTNLLC